MKVVLVTDAIGSTYPGVPASNPCRPVQRQVLPIRSSGLVGGMAVGITSIGIIRDANMRLLA
jgi:hypothetical protein